MNNAIEILKRLIEMKYELFDEYMINNKAGIEAPQNIKLAKLIKDAEDEIELNRIRSN